MNPRRATVVWWAVFLGPALIATAMIITNIVSDSHWAVLVFTIGVWAYSLMVGITAAPRSADGRWWVFPLAASFVAGIIGFLLLAGMTVAADRLPL